MTLVKTIGVTNAIWFVTQGSWGSRLAPLVSRHCVSEYEPRDEFIAIGMLLLKTIEVTITISFVTHGSRHLRPDRKVVSFENK